MRVAIQAMKFAEQLLVQDFAKTYSGNTAGQAACYGTQHRTGTDSRRSTNNAYMHANACANGSTTGR